MEGRRGQGSGSASVDPPARKSSGCHSPSLVPRPTHARPRPLLPVNVGRLVAGQPHQQLGRGLRVAAARGAQARAPPQARASRRHRRLSPGATPPWPAGCAHLCPQPCRPAGSAPHQHSTGHTTTHPVQRAQVAGHSGALVVHHLGQTQVSNLGGAAPGGGVATHTSRSGQATADTAPAAAGPTRGGAGWNAATAAAGAPLPLPMSAARRSPPVQQDVLALEVKVQDAAAVQEDEPARDVQRNLEGSEGA